MGSLLFLGVVHAWAHADSFNEIHVLYTSRQQIVRVQLHFDQNPCFYDSV